ncbi:MAG: type II secretion system protein GspM [Alphaproteobacteria bacterium]
MDNLSPFTRKFVAVGLLIVAVLLFLNLIVLPLSDRWAAREAAIADARRQIAAYREILARGPALKKQVEQIQADPGRRRGFLIAGSPALAGARLENRLKAIVQANGGKLRSTRVRPQTGEGPERVRVTLDFTASPGALLSIIYRIETAVPWLIADNVHIRAAPARAGRPPSASARMDVDAFIWREAT